MKMIKKSPVDWRRLPPVVKLLIGLFSAAVIINLAMVGIAVKNHSDLVRDDYYDHGLQQNTVNRDAARADSLGIHLTFSRKDSRWMLTLTASDSNVLSNKPLKGAVHFYRPSDNTRDIVLPLTQMGNGPVLHTPEVKLKPGFWQAKIKMIAGDWVLQKEFELHI
jgi:nitrogen fixation protein FixH